MSIIFLVRLKSVLKRDERWDDVVCNFKRSFLLQCGSALCQMLPAHIFLAPSTEQCLECVIFLSIAKIPVFDIICFLAYGIIILGYIQVCLY